MEDVKVQQTVIIAMEVIRDNLESLFQTDKTIEEAIGLLMTCRCNLTCQYCYVQKKRNKDMTLEMAQSILEPFLQTKGSMLTIAFMGGETLLAKEVIIPLVEWIKSKKWNRKFRCFGSTNGTLLSSSLKNWLYTNRNIFTLGLSYDGVPFSQLMNRGNDNIDIDFFLETWPLQPIQMTIHPQTVNKMAEGVIYLLERGAVVHPNIAFENYEWSQKSLIEYGKQLSILANYYIKHPEKPKIIQFVHDIYEYADRIDNHKIQEAVCGAGNGFHVYDVDGCVYPCHILSPLVLEGTSLDTIKKGIVKTITDFADPKCAKCPYISSCPTCIACNYLYRGKFQKRDETHCIAMKLEVKAYIKKEILRLKAKTKLTPEDAILVDSIRKIVDHEKFV